MQILIDRLNRPWGFDLQVGLVAGWLRNQAEDVSVLTREFNEEYFPSIDGTVSVSETPWENLKDEPTLCGPYPSCLWPGRAGISRYSVLLPYIPWDLYPSKKGKWLGRLPVYVTSNRTIVMQSLLQILMAPWLKTRRTYRRYRDRKAIAGAEEVFIYDDRLRRPVRDIYDRDPTLISPVAAIGSGKSTDPEQTILAVGPYEPFQNVKRIIDAFYVFVNRLGTQRREDWDGRNPMQMWQSGDFTLKLHGRGDGRKYLEEYVESQQLEDQVEFNDWIPTEDYDSAISSSLAVIDVPLGGDASPLVYHALSMGVPAVHTRHHRGLDTFLEDSELSFKTSSTDTTAIARGLLDAVRVPSSNRVQNKGLRKALDVESGAQHLKKQITANEVT